MHHLLCCLLAVGLMAGEVDVKAVKALHADCVKRGALWSVLQLEEWGRQQKPEVRLSALGDTLAVGSTLRALPEDILLLADLGGRVVATTTRQVHQCDPEGRPLAPAWTWAMETWDQFLGPQGLVIAAATVHRPERGGFRVQVQSLRLADGATVFERTIDVQRDRGLARSQVVSADGSAIALDLDGGGPQAAMVVTAEAVTHYAGISSLFGVGPRGAWLLGGDGRQWLALVQGKPRPVRAAAHGAGCAVILPVEGGPQLIRADGTVVDVTVGMGIGRNPTCTTVGDWLVVASGDGATTMSDDALLGIASAQVEQPPTLALWRWADLARDPQAPPQTLMPGQLSVAWNCAASLVVWADRTVACVDLDGEQPVRRVVREAPYPVDWAGIDKHLMILDLGQDRREVLAEDGTVLWQGTARQVWVCRRNLALTMQVQGDGPPAFQVQTLSAKTEERRSAALQLPAQPWNIAIDAWRNRAVATADNQPWHELALDGKLRSQATQADQRVPAVEVWNPPAGRFDRFGPRWFPKVAGQPADLPQRLMLRDAWRFPTPSGAVTALISDSQQVWFPGRKRGEWLDLGAAPTGDRFAMAGKQPVVLSWERDAHIVRVLAPGPALVEPQQVARLGVATEMQPGPWRVDGWRFVVPGGGEMLWDPQRAGFAPRRLRSPDKGGLLVVTRSVAIDLDKDVVRWVGKAP